MNAPPLSSNRRGPGRANQSPRHATTAACAALFLAIALTFAGCGRNEPTGAHEPHDHGDAHDHGHAEEKETGSATFKEGQGLQLADETFAALGVETAKVEERAITPAFEIIASVFDAGPPARASSLAPAEVVEALEEHPPAEARLLATRRDFAHARSQVEIILELPGAPAVGTTLNLTLRGSTREGAAVPRSAVLRSATGTFVYVVNGSHLLRAPVQTGASDGEYIEILDGLHTGDVVVTAAVEQLWLTELRLTKGGGHSH